MARQDQLEKQRKALRERDTMFRRWKRWHAEQLLELQAGPWREEIDELLEFLSGLGPDDGQALIDLVDRHGWARACAGTRFLVLRQIDLAIVRVREAHGMAPFNDALPFSDDELTTFQIIKAHLFDGDAATSSDSASG